VIAVESRNLSVKKVTETQMEIIVEKVRKEALIKLSGRLDMNTSPDLRKAALALYTKGGIKHVTIDFTEVSFIDTSALATLLDIQMAAKEQSAQLTLSELNEKVQYLIDVNGLTGFFRIVSSAQEKLHA
jgi:anti-anti-sigma factor